MSISLSKFNFSIVVALMLAVLSLSAKDTEQQSRMKVALRKIGHELLLSTGDSTSRVLPVVRTNNSYELSFETEFEFLPDELVFLFKSILEEGNMAESYLAEVLDCESKEVVYSYEYSDAIVDGPLQCKGRLQPKGCYTVVFTIYEYPPNPHTLLSTESKAASAAPQGFLPMAVSIILVIIISALWLFYRKRESVALNTNVIALGAYGFDTLNMELLLRNEKTELTSKECDLLQLLYDSANNTIERDTILNKVWGDEGDYVGRTLDVFISKLRKKLEADPNLKIVNVRGVGYKLVVNS